MVGQRRHICDVRIADHDIGNGLFDAHILGLADGHAHDGGALGTADLHQPLRVGLARRRQRLRHRQCRDRGEFGEEPPPRLRACASPPPRPACPLPMPLADGRSTTPVLVVHLKPPHPFDTSPKFFPT